jgi:hypothetical protein
LYYCFPLSLSLLSLTHPQGPDLTYFSLLSSLLTLITPLHKKYLSYKAFKTLPSEFISFQCCNLWWCWIALICVLLSKKKEKPILVARFL